jgi:hypothetical protein
MDIGLAWKSKARLSPAASAFCEFVASLIPGPIRFISIEGPAARQRDPISSCPSRSIEMFPERRCCMHDFVLDTFDQHGLHCQS